MRFDLIFTDEAERGMAKLSPDLLTFLEARLSEFADAPRECGARAAVSPPFPPGGMIVHFKRDFLSREMPACHFTIHFLYATDEVSLIITNVVAQFIGP